MSFNSLEYAALLILVVALTWGGDRRLQNSLLLAASYVFYAFWDARFLALICVSTYVDFIGAQLISAARIDRRRLWLANAYVLLGVFGFAWLGSGFSLGASDGSESLWSRAHISQPLLAVVLVVLVTSFATRAVAWSDKSRRRVFLGLCLVTNLGILGVFKYLGFFVDTGVAALSRAGFAVTPSQLQLVLPVGLSFYTFQTLSYSIDVYRRDLEPCEDLLDFSLFVAYFPQLVAGPIVRAGRLLPQLASARPFRLSNIYAGTPLILLGLMKKMAIADAVAPTVNAVFSSPGAASGSDVALAAVLFSIQIVGDFSGYTDIARGSSRLLGIELPANFRLPYLAGNPQEFWRRWHISLSTWLRDYVYIPLGGNRSGARGAYRNVMITMLLGGLWHGAGWNFVLWGGVHGVALCVHHAFRAPVGRRGASHSLLGTSLRVVALYVFVCYTWLLFRAHNMEDIQALSTALLGVSANPGLPLVRPSAAFFLAFPTLVGYLLLRSGRLTADPWRFAIVRGATYAGMVIAILIAAGQDAPAGFIYFQF